MKKELVGAVAELGFLAVDHGIGETVDVPGSFPDGGVHDNAGIEPFNVFAALDKVAPPGLLDVVAQFDAEWAVIKEAVVAAVDFGGGEDKASAFTEADEFFHESIVGCRCSHRKPKMLSGDVGSSVGCP